MPLAGTTNTETRHAWDGLEYEQMGGMSRKVVTVQANASNPTLYPGCVLGKITAGNWTIHDNAAVDGSQTLAYDAAGVLLAATGPNGPNVTSLTGESAVIVFHDAVVNADKLQWASGMDSTEQTTAMGTLRTTADIQIDCRS